VAMQGEGRRGVGARVMPRCGEVGVGEEKAARFSRTRARARV